MGIDHGHGVLFAGHDDGAALFLPYVSIPFFLYRCLAVSLSLFSLGLWFPPTAATHTRPIWRYFVFFFLISLRRPRPNWKKTCWSVSSQRTRSFLAINSQNSIKTVRPNRPFPHLETKRKIRFFYLIFSFSLSHLISF